MHGAYGHCRRACLPAFASPVAGAHASMHCANSHFKGACFGLDLVIAAPSVPGIPIIPGVSLPGLAHTWRRGSQPLQPCQHARQRQPPPPPPPRALFGPASNFSSHISPPLPCHGSSSCSLP
eukprot:351125-Chlamydomonas_euryale.AAC.5